MAALAVVGLLLQPLGVDALDEFGHGRCAHGVARAADVEHAGHGGPALVGMAEDADLAAVQRHAPAGEGGIKVGHCAEVARFVGGRSEAGRHTGGGNGRFV